MNKNLVPLISVIVPVYNVEKYLEKCINSIISQSYSNLEIILVDDGSTDKSSQICNEYLEKDSRIKVIRTSGPPVRRGRTHSRGSAGRLRGALSHGRRSHGSRGAAGQIGRAHV